MKYRHQSHSLLIRNHETISLSKLFRSNDMLIVNAINFLMAIPKIHSESVICNFMTRSIGMKSINDNNYEFSIVRFFQINFMFCFHTL